MSAKFYDIVQSRQADYIRELREAVAIRSVSADAKSRESVCRMGDYMAKKLQSIGAKVSCADVGTQDIDGATLPLPPLVLGTLTSSGAMRTLLVYGHYDVQPANKSDGWESEPFELTEMSDGRLVGRGSTDDKGPILGWIWAIEALQKAGVALPVNVKFIFEGMEESGSEGLDEYIAAHADDYKDVDVVCISDNYWLGTKKPCLTYGLRGIAYYKVSVAGPRADLHSGVFGGTVHEPMTDLVNILSELVTPDGKILIPGIMDSVAPLTDHETKMYEGLDFGLQDLYDSVGSKINIHDNAMKTLLHR